ncbi:putative transcription elongation factor [Paraburkholderia atlantica]|uniref:Transcription elongation factor n=1 Tax=Paraburkholderia atlantica TaxID=2654982 RepID=D5WJ85_PARAM|nr:DUF6496 domain-containing protein [Paraburkholderia atlantica]ADG18530.1 putative transcription elongation factor [Paraburkholderia atlantica]
MPEQKTLKRAAADKRAGKSASTQAGEFIKEQVDKVRAGKHGVRSPKQAIAIGLSEARRAGVDVKPPKKGATSETTRKKAQKDSAAGKHVGAKKSASNESSAKRSRVSESVLKRESKAGASSAAMSKQAKSAAAERPAASRSAAAKKAAATKGAAGRSAAAKKAAQTRASRAHH